ILGERWPASTRRTCPPHRRGTRPTSRCSTRARSPRAPPPAQVVRRTVTILFEHDAVLRTYRLLFQFRPLTQCVRPSIKPAPSLTDRVTTWPGFGRPRAAADVPSENAPDRGQGWGGRGRATRDQWAPPSGLRVNVGGLPAMGTAPADTGLTIRT